MKIPIIDAGHGGLDAENNYVTAPTKMYRFKNIEFDYPFGKRNEIYEGYINREIAKLVIGMLQQERIPYYEKTVSTHIDVPLRYRAQHANDVYSVDKRSYLLSIHSNAAAERSSGMGTTAEGFEIFTSKSQTESDKIATTFCDSYKKTFPDVKFRQDYSDGDPDKEKNFYVLRKTRCPAVLVENLFFNNPVEAKFLMSKSGQILIAKAIYDAIEKLYYKQ